MSTITPVVHLPTLFGHASIWLKMEMDHLTGSHKDRESRAVVASAIASGYTALGCATTGNYGIALAYYARCHNLDFYVWATPAIPDQTLQLIRALGAHIIIKNMAFDRLIEESTKYMRNIGAMNANPGYCEHKLSAHATLARELTSQIPAISVVVTPVNNGSLLLGLARSLPPNVRLFGVTTKVTKAKSIAEQSFVEGKEKIEAALYNRQGSLINVNESELNEAHQLLIQHNIVAEYASASVVAALPKIKFDNVQDICCIITGKHDKTTDLTYHMSKFTAKTQEAV